jgi:hypothetical protein
VHNGVAARVNPASIGGARAARRLHWWFTDPGRASDAQGQR